MRARSSIAAHFIHPLRLTCVVNEIGVKEAGEKSGVGITGKLRCLTGSSEKQ